MFDWIEQLADKVVYDWMGMAHGLRLAEAIHFFIYDSIKILLLLFTVILLMGVVNSYFPVERVKNHLANRNYYGLEFLVASLFGVVTPFCSCSSVPLFIGFVSGGIPLGVTFAFLVTSPLVNEVAVGLFVGLFGMKTTVIYVVTGVLLGTISGMILQRLRLERYLTPWVKDLIHQHVQVDGSGQDSMPGFKDRIPVIWREAMKILRGVLPYVIIGIAIGGFMHGYIPDGFFEKYMQKDNVLAVPAATLLAVPMYTNASGVLPIVQVLVSKGIPLGTAMAFMMAVVGLSLPEAMLLKKVMTMKLIGIFFGVVTLSIIFSGYLFNLIF